MNPKRPLLVPLVPIYGVGVAARNWFFDIGVLKSRRVAAPVLCVGNIEAGGVGKTPLVELLARKLQQKGRRVAVVSRGYGRTTAGTVVVSDGQAVKANAAEAGDEPAQMASKLLGTIVVVDENRVRGAERAIKDLEANVIILDDGFQHRYLSRDLDIVVVTAEHAFDPGWLLPAGNRREPMASLHRASIVAVSRCESDDQFVRASDAIRRWTKGSIIRLAAKVSAFRKASTRFSVDLAGLKGKSAVAFSGIGDPGSFEQTLKSLGLVLRHHFSFPDHHNYAAGEMNRLEALIRETGADFLVTTEKDAVRLSAGTDEFKALVERTPVYVVEIESKVLEGESLLNEALERL